MQVWTEVRRKVLVEQVPKRQICRDYQISHHTLEKMIQNVEPVTVASSMIPKYLRRSTSIDALAAFAYLKGVSESDVASVLEVMLGEGALILWGDEVGLRADHAVGRSWSPGGRRPWSPAPGSASEPTPSRRCRTEASSTSWSFPDV
jgi:hypothetical protein